MEDNRNGAPHASNIYLNISSTGTHYEPIEEFGTSFFRLVYVKAFQQLDHIINSNFKHQDGLGIRETNKGSSGFYFRSSKKKPNNGYDSFSNIITFVGKRGTGKSSAMLSFMEALKDYYRYCNDGGSPVYKLAGGKDILFTCLDCIDGSLLEHGEDIFKIVLAQIYKKFIDLDRSDQISKEDDFDYRKRELFKQMEEIYRTVCDIESMEKNHKEFEGSYMSSLKSLSSSQKVKKDFETLILRFTSLMKYEHLGRRESIHEHYVIITIDDIDLNISNGFSMLEKIHRYCMVQNVIVLLSVDIGQMLSIVSKKFYKVVPKVDVFLRREEEYVRKLAIDYLDKIMPVNYRIYIPEISDSFSSYLLSTQKEKMDIKKSILWNLYRRVGICFDSQGTKRHFYEPKSLRQLTCFYLMLESMGHLRLDEIYKSNESDLNEKRELLERWEDNYKILTAELFNRIALEKKYAFKEMEELCEVIRKGDALRVRDYVVCFCYEHLREGEESDIKSDTGSDEKVFLKRHEKLELEKECSYGRLVEAIYGLEYYENASYKPLTDYLLVYFSYIFTREYIYEKLAIKNNGKALVKPGNFQLLLGKNILENWSDKLLPFTFRSRDEDTGIGEESAFNTDINRQAKYFGNYENVGLTNMFSGLLIKGDTFKTRKEKCEYAAQLIGNLEFLSMFFSNIKEKEESEKIIDIDSLEWEFTLDCSNSEYNALWLNLAVNGNPRISFVGNYNILHFVKNSMNAVERLGKIETALIKGLSKEYKGGATRRLFDLELKKYSLKSRFEKWQQEFGELALPIPVHWFDFTYNLLKRVKRTLSEENILSVEGDSMFVYMKRLYEIIAEQLEEQEAFYSLTKKESDSLEELYGDDSYVKQGVDDSYQLAARFRKCPVVEYFLGQEDKTTDGEKGYQERFIDWTTENLKRFSRKFIVDEGLKYGKPGRDHSTAL